MFDPYHKWLGIPKDQRPPSYYQLLGISPTEADPEVIEEAAIRQSMHLRGYQIGPHADDCTRLLGEIAQARATLLQPGLRRQYDARLAPAATVATPDDAVTAQAPRAVAAAPVEHFADLGEPEPRRRPAPPPPRSVALERSNTALIVFASLAGFAMFVGMVVIVIVLMRQGAAVEAPRAGNPPIPPPAPPKKGHAQPGNGAIKIEPVVNRLPPNFADAPLDAWRVELPESCNRLAISADGSTVAAGGFRHVYLIDYAKKTWRPAVPIHAHDVRAFALAPNGALLAAGDQGSLTLCDLATGQAVHKLPHDAAATVSCAAFSRDGRKLATGTSSPDPLTCLVRLWDVATGQQLWSAAGHQKLITCVALAPNGDVISRGVDLTYRRWSAAAGAAVRSVNNPRLLRENFAPEARQVLATWQDNRTIELWDLDANRTLRTFGAGRNAIRLAWGGDGKTALAADDQGQLSFWDVTQGKLIVNRGDHTGIVTSLAISTEGTTAVSGGIDKTVRFWNLHRLAAAQKLDQKPGPAPMLIHDYLTENTIARLPARSGLGERVGGEGGSPFFRFHKEAKPLLGFLGAVASWNNRPMVRMLHPLYGRDHPEPKADQTLLLAKDGYAVAGLNAVGDDYCWAIQVIFARNNGAALDLNDTYTSPWLSEPRNDPVRRLGMTGSPVLGIYGRQGLNSDALGLILALPPDVAMDAAPKVLLKQDGAFAGNEPTDRVFRQQGAHTYVVELRAGEVVNIVAQAGLQMPLYIRLSSQDQALAAAHQHSSKAHIWNFVVPRTAAYRVTVVNLVADRRGPFTLTVTAGPLRPDAP